MRKDNSSGTNRPSLSVKMKNVAFIPHGVQPVGSRCSVGEAELGNSRLDTIHQYQRDEHDRKRHHRWLSPLFPAKMPVRNNSTATNDLRLHEVWDRSTSDPGIISPLFDISYARAVSGTKRAHWSGISCLKQERLAYTFSGIYSPRNMQHNYMMPPNKSMPSCSTIQL